ncbi:MAG: hypothetical protein MUC50_07940, partial [Myxococcota bacterium]|nr:hypothetical protein [Myxococcota bacterium]
RKTPAIALAFFVAASATLFPLLASTQVIKHDGGVYVVSVTTSGGADKGSATVSATGKAGYHCNTLYPWKLTLRTGSTERVLKREQAKVFSEAKVVFQLDDVSLGSTKAEIKLSVCNDKLCQTEKVDLSF